jgi:AraC family transcriptional regulator
MSMDVRPRTVSVQRRTDQEAGWAAAGHPNRVLYDTGLVKIGAFRCSRDNPLFENSGPIQNYCFVFPRTAVVIEHEHDRPFVANPNVVTFYNRRDEYRRRPISEAGDRSDWFALRHDIVVDVARSVAPQLDQRSDRPFQVTHALSTSRTYAFQRQLFARISQRIRLEPIEVEEGVISLLESVLRSADRRDDARTPLAGVRRRRELAHEAKSLLSGEFARNLSLGELAARLDVSVFHLCRVFRQLVGCSLHEYRTQLRLRGSLENLGARRPRALVDCALDAGFSSHSHYGAAFKRSFGQTPSSFVRGISSPLGSPS